MAFSVDEDRGKVTVLAKVDPVSVSTVFLTLVNIQSLVGTGLKANSWIDEVKSVLGGKGGGKEGNANLTGDDASQLDKAVELARQFAKISVN